MRISIIIPVYNVAEYILPCLESVAAQDWDGDIECLIVDDCGTDSSMKIAGRFVSDYSGSIKFMILRHTHNRGLSASRNTGMGYATGEYIFFLDSDDELTCDCLRLLAAPAKGKEIRCRCGELSDSLVERGGMYEKGKVKQNG